MYLTCFSVEMLKHYTNEATVYDANFNLHQRG